MGNDPKTSNTSVFMEEDFTSEKIDNLVKKDKKEYIVDVDVEYPKELHKNHTKLPFLAERMKIAQGGKTSTKSKDKNAYLLHIKSLNQALKHALILKKVHRVIEFQHSNWMEPKNGCKE